MPGVTRQATIHGLSAQQLYDVVTDYERYPGFFTDFTRVVIQNKAENVWTVEFVAKVVKEVSYTLRIEHDPEALKTKWSFIRGKLISDSTGGWTFTDVNDGKDARIDYEAAIEVNAPLPKFVKNKIQDAVLNRSIGSMFTQLEREARKRKG